MIKFDFSHQVLVIQLGDACRILQGMDTARLILKKIANKICVCGLHPH